ncbi:unnamed protein product [Diamesa serratosioi]
MHLCMKQFVHLLWLKMVLGSGFGKCPNFPSMPKFNIEKFLGKWQEVERSFYFPEIANGCTSIAFQNSSAKNNDGIIVYEIAIKTINQWTQSPGVLIGTMETETQNSSIMNIQLQTRLPAPLARLTNPFLPGSGKYQVLFSDYDNFSIFYSCSNFGIAYTDQIWLLGRDKDFAVEIRTKIYDILTKLGLDSERLVLAKNTNCPSLL